MRLLFKFDGEDGNDADFFEQHFDSYDEAIDYIEDLYIENPQNLLQTSGFALFGILPDDQATNDEFGSNALEKVANWANLLVDGRGTPEMKALHKNLAGRNISLLEYEFEQGRVSHEQLGVEGCERMLDRTGGRITGRARQAKLWLDNVKPNHRHRLRQT